jgi:hypothetical protein
VVSQENPEFFLRFEEVTLTQLAQASIYPALFYQFPENLFQNLIDSDPIALGTFCRDRVFAGFGRVELRGKCMLFGDLCCC